MSTSKIGFSLKISHEQFSLANARIVQLMLAVIKSMAVSLNMTRGKIGHKYERKV